MRIYVSSEFSKFFSAVAMVVAFALFGFAVWKGITLLDTNGDLKEIQELVDQAEQQ